MRLLDVILEIFISRKSFPANFTLEIVLWIVRFSVSKGEVSQELNIHSYLSMFCRYVKVEPQISHVADFLGFPIGGPRGAFTFHG